MGTKTPKTADVGEWALLEAHLPGLPSETIGILLRDFSHDILHVRLRSHWWHGLLDEEESAIWSELSGHLHQSAREIGAAQVLNWLENTASHAIQISARQEIRLTQVEVDLDTLYRQYLGALETRFEPSDGRREQTPVCLSQSEALRCSRKRNRYFHFQSGWARAAVAATLLMGATLAGIWSKRQHPSILKQEWNLYQQIALPSFTEPHYQPVLFNVDCGSELHRPTRHYRNKRHRISSRIRFHLQRQPAFAQPQIIRVAYLEPPILEFAPEVSGAPSLALSTPEAPEFRPRRNRFIRVLAAMAIPFRLMFMSKHLVESGLPSS